MKKIIITLSTAMLLVGCNAGVANSNYPYQLVIDAGSSGSRIYVYNKVATESGVILADLYEKKTSLPLASFAMNPTVAGTSIQPLLESAISYLTTTVPNINLASVPTSVLGTAGMRLINPEQQTAIYQNLSESIAEIGLKAGEINTISGKNEGLYSWLDVNYLQHNLAKEKPTAGIFEVGGASAQVAFATTESFNQDSTRVLVNGVTYNIYSTSFLGLGQDAARNTMNLEPNHNQCYPSGYNDQLTINGAFQYTVCMENYAHVINNYPQINLINQVPTFYTQNFVGVSSVYYALNFWGIESDPSALSQKIQTTCSEPYSQMQAKYPNAFSLQNQCANSVLMNKLIFDELKFAPNQLTAVPAINGTSLSYTLGFALLNY